jgi:xenotropic and polytropic retrovirus receptor 1
MTVLREQLEELKDHRRLFYEVNTSDQKTLLWPPGRQRLPQILEEDPIFVHRRRKQQPPPLAGAGKAASYGATVQPQPQQRGGKGKASRATSLAEELDPDEYHAAKKKLKKAVLEFYR